MSQTMSNLPEGVLRSGCTLDGVYLRVEYTAEHGYEVGGRFRWLRRVSSLDLALAMFEACSMANWSDAREVTKHVLAESRRIRGLQFMNPAQKQWCWIRGALNRLEGKRPIVHGRTGRQVEQWL